MQGNKDSPHFRTRGKGQLGKAKSEGTIFRPSWPSEKIGLLCFLIVLEKNLSLYELVYIDNSAIVKYSEKNIPLNSKQSAFSSAHYY